MLSLLSCHLNKIHAFNGFTCSENDFVANRIAKFVVSLIAWISCVKSWCLHTLLMVHLASSHDDGSVSSLLVINHSAYSETQGCSMQGQQCYRHLLTSYLIFETVLIVYGIILKSTGVTWRSVFVQGIVRVGYSPPCIYYELLLILLAKKRRNSH